MIVYVVFSDSSLTRVVTVFGGAQDPSFHENYAEINDDDPRLINFYKRLNFETV